MCAALWQDGVMAAESNLTAQDVTINMNGRTAALQQEKEEGKRD